MSAASTSSGGVGLGNPGLFSRAPWTALANVRRAYYVERANKGLHPAVRGASLRSAPLPAGEAQPLCR